MEIYMPNRRTWLKVLGTAGTVGAIGGFVVFQPGEEPVIPDQHYEPGNVVIENWDDDGRSLYITVEKFPSSEAGTMTTVFESSFTVDARSTALRKRVIETTGRFRAAVRTGDGETAEHDGVLVRESSSGELAGRGIRIRTYADKPVSLVAFSE